MLRLRVFTLTPARVGFSSLVLITRWRSLLVGCCCSLLLLLGKRGWWGDVWVRWGTVGDRLGRWLGRTALNPFRTLSLKK